MRRTLTESLADFVVSLKYEEIPASGIESAKGAILDCIGCALAGARSPAAGIVSDWVKDEGGRAVATVFGRGFRAPVASAALANGTAGHALDFDDTNPPLIGHPSVPLVPAIVAVGEAVGASGRDLLLAYVIGFDVEARLGRLMNPPHYAHGWHATSTMGTLAAAAAVSRLLGQTKDQVRAAIGIAASGAAGLRQNFGSMVKPLHGGQAAYHGTMAALLAARGFTADPDILDGPMGYVNVYRGSGSPDPQSISFGGGQPLEIVASGVGIKRYACCGCTHTALDALLGLISEHRIQPDDIQGIQCEVNSLAPGVLIHHEVSTPLQGKFSMEYCLAVAALDGQAGLSQFTDARVRDAKAQDLLHRVRMTVGDDIPVNQGVFPSRVTISLKNGTSVSQRVDQAKGHPERPLKVTELSAKFRDCATQVLSPDQASRTLDMLLNLERLPLAAELGSVLLG